jgi:small conductance mechanosensitive channel
VDIQEIIAQLTGLVSTWGLRLLGALAVFILGKWVAGRVRRWLRARLETAGTDATLVPFFSGLAYYLMLTFVILAVLGIVGIQATSVIAVLGAAGLAVGLAMQGTLSNFASGVMLLLFRPFRVGDFIDVGGVSGTAQEIGVFATTLNTPDNVRVIVPNSAIYGQTIKNFSTNDLRRNDMTVGVAYSDNIQTAVNTVREILVADSRVLEEPAPVIAVAELADSSVNLVVRPWCKKEDYWDLRWDLTRRFKEELERSGCNIPFPQHDVHLHQASGA